MQRHCEGTLHQKRIRDDEGEVVKKKKERARSSDVEEESDSKKRRSGKAEKKKNKEEFADEEIVLLDSDDSKNGSEKGDKGRSSAKKRREKKGGSEQKEEKSKKPAKPLLPRSLPRILSRIEGDPIEYQCQWSKQEPRIVSIDELVNIYGEKIVPLVNGCDVAANVGFEAENIVDKRKGEYLVHWKGYPDVFESWELAGEKRWKSEDKNGKHKKKLVEEYERNRK
jgi:hypothetical protein